MMEYVQPIQISVDNSAHRLPGPDARGTTSTLYTSRDCAINAWLGDGDDRRFAEPRHSNDHNLSRECGIAPCFTPPTLSPPTFLLPEKFSVGIVVLEEIVGGTLPAVAPKPAVSFEVPPKPSAPCLAKLLADPSTRS